MAQIVWPPAQGEYRGDFTRDSFLPFLNFTRVLMQQGRVTLDADWNEQVSILLHLARTLTADLLGPYAGTPGAFKIEHGKNAANKDDIKIGAGRYYVGGLLCENRAQGGAFYQEQEGYPLIGDEQDVAGFPYLVYLDAWERHVTGSEAAEIMEPALNGVDTATRAQVVWQVKLWRPPAGAAGALDVNKLKTDEGWAEFVAKNWRFEKRPQLKAWVAPLDDLSDTEPCLIPSDAGYRGLENQLYRVEIHAGGEAGKATFKWSRNNSSEYFPVKAGGGTQLAVTSLGRDDASALRRDQWVELVARENALRGEPGTLYQAAEVDAETLTVTLSAAPTANLAGAVLRRWDQTTSKTAGANGLPLDAGKPVEIEDGIRVQFDANGVYRPGDYWLIPARTATRDILWPRQDMTANPNLKAEDAAHLLPPHGPAHHYAPLAVVKGAAAADVISLRREIDYGALVKGV